MLSINVMPIINARGIEKPYTYLVKAGLTPHSANFILNGKPRVLTLNNIELLCRVLVCEPNDIIVYTPNAKQPLPTDHPLNNLVQTETPKDLKKSLATIPYKELKAITKQLNGL